MAYALAYWDYRPVEDRRKQSQGAKGLLYNEVIINFIALSEWLMIGIVEVRDGSTHKISNP
jgi:hypothetical protein